MGTEQSEHAHEHALVEIADGETVSAFEERPHEVVTLRFHDRGLSLDLTFQEAAALAAVMAQVEGHIAAQSSG